MRGALLASALIGCAKPQPSAAPHELVVKEARPTRTVPPPPRLASSHATDGLALQLDANGVLHISARVSPILLNPATQHNLKLGLVVNVTWSIEIYAPHRTQPSARGAYHCRVAYDVANEMFAIKTSLGAKPPAVNLNGVARWCLALDSLPLQTLTPLTAGVPHHVSAKAVVDPGMPNSASEVVDGTYVP